ncbi:pantoate--beta-alanine ligase [Bradyrhizobium sp. 24]|nr:pantoate--beta-alanine ligase [Bradyrhizobium sp. 84]MCK1295092.1 pantoate--beta-alanine ligase [Bradyrhizobium sp. 30]MCK1296703.1 pantoate--beta-alanine ligase [Bradyrhizobium sp. 37]MCK1315964.1 pantoate--beta-alanine ligase [Bradyrhizobium sp. 23]MCK1332257.1 pantoate--beta-alanine ligase [Bradyrhizobium sp. CW9]MCK1344827.1 pantoate--beta-alanine ligase [Bradyrhizobium sp. CW11]MCK1350420.1 pantoate--beta-alanine ligase [Bradyrhizobium sp. CW7]MCK1374871.1 pantoate--beta-alanine liga
MSSRNRYLIQEERRRAGAIRGGLFAARAEFQAGERDGKELLVIAEQYLETVDRLQYLELFDADTLEPVESPLHRPATLCAAAYIGSTHLIDNVLLDRICPVAAPSCL